ncbi:Uncharacterized membrane protein YcaP, DUF421 family [Mucilaginibacter pineti]|uniref:Uncharacterized membrane protein YcaP, DUF421 family n=1 Tax=Mucilaginibacter pineti TaxID=1391627 RepID=A0A1G7H5V3_9SPHI|nr:YetF domain-containing protein [Mucilaginibacter pineti]SDE95519.1 Uncharacterized membrane protein YcaP, DUF421 family [Mucilaginibacter pineti]
MKKEDIRLYDWARILFGEAPPFFLLEVFIRTLIIYIFLLYTLRWLGKRMSGQLTIMELSVMLTLGAIVSASMQLPDHGILAGFLLLLCALAFQRGISYIGVLNSHFEELTQGRPGTLIKDGVLQLDELKKFRVSRQQIFAQLRNQKIYNLGLVERMYLEASGMYSIFSAAEPKPGLSVLPPDDSKIQTMQTEDQDLMACRSCGMVQQTSENDSCNDCGCREWTRAVN